MDAVAAAGLTHRAEPAPETLFAAALAVVESVRAAPSASAGIDAALDRIVEVLDVDRGMLVLHEPGGYDVVVNARSRGRALPPLEREELSRSLVRRARQTATVQTWDAFEAEGVEGSAADLGLLAAAAVPLCVGEGGPEDVLGALYVDVRDQQKTLGPRHQRFLVLVACVLAATVRGDRELARARDAVRRVEATQSGDAVPLWSLLAPAGMQGIADDVMAAVRGDASTLILGESGTGKTALAHAIARASTDGPVVRATLGMSDDLNTIISELFGHVRGAFSGAGAGRVGLVEHADGGCLVVDEILNMPPHAQQLLLDFTQFGTYRPLGWEQPEPKRAHVRILAATQGDVESAIAAGRLRRDLYYRLAGIVVRVPPLRERRADIPALAEGILRRRDPSRSWTLSLALRRWIVRAPHPWPGNVRELEAVLMRARHRALLEDDALEVIDRRHVDTDELGGDAAVPELTASPSSAPPPIGGAAAGTLEARWGALETTRESLTDEERTILEAALAEEGGVVSRVARRLGVPRTTLVHRLRVLSIGPGPRG